MANISPPDGLCEGKCLAAQGFVSLRDLPVHINGLVEGLSDLRHSLGLAAYRIALHFIRKRSLHHVASVHPGSCGLATLSADLHRLVLLPWLRDSLDDGARFHIAVHFNGLYLEWSEKARPSPVYCEVRHDLSRLALFSCSHACIPLVLQQLLLIGDQIVQRPDTWGWQRLLGPWCQGQSAEVGCILRR